jgi:SAM-dependent methyltransferase
MLENSESFWSETWSRHFQAYTRTIPRQAYYLSFLLSDAERVLLEIGAGSYRDTARLNRWGRDCTGVDFCPEACTKARAAYPEFAAKLLTMDAFALEFGDKSFDLSFHNGLLIVLDDAAISKLLREQVRVTRKRIVCTVHNALRRDLVQQFAELSARDKLYDIRFFMPDELRELVAAHCDSVEIRPFGHPAVDRWLRWMPWRPFLGWKYRRVCGGDLSSSERLMAVGRVSGR